MKETKDTEVTKDTKNKTDSKTDSTTIQTTTTRYHTNHTYLLFILPYL